MWTVIFSLISGFIICLLQLIRRPNPLWDKKSMGSHGGGSRDLGELEKELACWGEHGHNQVCSVLFFRSKLRITENILMDALNGLVRRHPILRMRFGHENGVLSYMKEMEDFQVDLKISKTKDWKKLVEDELLDVIDVEKGPIWRMKLLPGISNGKSQSDYPHEVTLVTSLSHACGDGLSASKMGYELLNLLENITHGKHPINKPLPLLPPIDYYLELNNKHSFANNLKINLVEMACCSLPFRKIIDKVHTRKTLLYNGSFGNQIKSNSNTLFKTCIIPFELTIEQTSALIASCKVQKVTVNSAIQTACCIAYCSLADAGKSKQVHELKLKNAYSLLDSSTPEELIESIGLYATSFAVGIKVDPELDFWEITRETDKRTLNELKMRKKENSIKEIRSLKFEKSYTKGKEFKGEKTEDLFVSNFGDVGFLRRNPKRNLELTGMFYALAHHKTGYVFNNIMLTYNGKLFWTLSYSPHATSMNLAQAYVDLTLKTLFAAVKYKSSSI